MQIIDTRTITQPLVRALGEARGLLQAEMAYAQLCRRHEPGPAAEAYRAELETLLIRVEKTVEAYLDWQR